MFYKSRKFAYAFTMLVVSLVLALLPAALDLDAQQTDTINEMVPFALFFGFFLISGHTIMDALSMAKGVQVPSVSGAVDEFVSAIDGNEG